MSRISFAGQDVEAVHVDKGQQPSRRMTQPLADTPIVQFANPAGDEYEAYVDSAAVTALRPGTSGLYEHDGVTEEVTVTAILPGRSRSLGAVIVSTGVITVLLGALAGTIIEPGPGTALGAAAALIGSIGVGMPLAMFQGSLFGADQAES